MLVPVGVKYAIHHPFWFKHGKSGDPKQFFDSLDATIRPALLKSIEGYCLVGRINTDRGHDEPWVGKQPPRPTGVMVFKFKNKLTVDQIYACIHEYEGISRLILVHGCKGHQGKRKEKDDPTAKRNRVTAQEQILEAIGLPNPEGYIP